MIAFRPPARSPRCRPVPSPVVIRRSAALSAAGVRGGKARVLAAWTCSRSSGRAIRRSRRTARRSPTCGARSTSGPTRAGAAIWLVGRDGDNHRPLAGGAGNQSSPRWSPDGARLAFVAADADGAQIHMHWFSAGRHRARDEPARRAGAPRVVARRPPARLRHARAREARTAQGEAAGSAEGREVGGAAEGDRPDGLSRGRRRIPAGRVRPGVRRAGGRRRCAPADRRALRP